MEVIVELERELAEDLAAGRESARADALRETLATLGAALEPLHPGTADPDLARYHAVRVATAKDGEAMALLRTRSGVLAAYAKPAGELP